MSPQVFLILSRAIEEHTGIHYSDNDAPLLAGKIAPRALERGFESLLDYYYFLRYDPAGRQELDALAEHLVVNETYFFREAQPLIVLIDQVIRPLLAQGRRARVWSAACATGEEPLTLAMLLKRRGLLGQVDIVASDLSVNALQKAQSGVYGGRSLRALPHPDSLVSVDGRVPRELVDAVAWHRINLLDTPAIRLLGSFDVVLCRNVLIYFSDDVAARVVAEILAMLAPHGLLAVGVSESLLRLGALVRCEERGGYFFYRPGAA